MSEASPVTSTSAISPRRVATGIVLAAWAGLFWFLLLTDRTSLYLSTRTDWVVPVGAGILTAAVIGRGLSLVAPHRESLSGRDSFAFAILVVPVVIVVLLPPASLSSFAASRRSSLSGASFLSSGADVSRGDLSLVDVAGAMRTEEGRRALADRAGDRVTFTGFVTRDPGMPADEFVLTRFVISCCVADALGVEVRVAGAPPGKFSADEWVRATGPFYPLSNEVVIDATEVTRVERPQHPYLSP